jgi:light-regulated signal transduction histidine kinase (bacteriophytochrome)
MDQEKEPYMIDSSIIEEYTKLNNELINLRRDLLQKNRDLNVLVQSVELKNAELEQIIRAISHDLKQPLTSIGLDLYFLAEKYQTTLPQKGLEVIERMRRISGNLGSLIDDLVKYARLGYDTCAMGNVDMQALVDECKDIMQGVIAESGVIITTDPLPVVVGCKTLLYQLIQNLIGNAIKFRRGTPPLIHINASETKDAWEFEVKDNGMGIEEKYIDQLFNVFKRAHPDSKIPGNGIGLSICKKVAQLHGGRIWVVSTVGEGTTFHFTLQKGVRKQ